MKELLIIPSRGLREAPFQQSSLSRPISYLRYIIGGSKESAEESLGALIGGPTPHPSLAVTIICSPTPQLHSPPLTIGKVPETKQFSTSPFLRWPGTSLGTSHRYSWPRPSEYCGDVTDGHPKDLHCRQRWEHVLVHTSVIIPQRKLTQCINCKRIVYGRVRPAICITSRVK